MGTRRFDAQFQGRPRPDTGALFKREWFANRYRALPSDIVRGAIYLDGAWKTGVGNDRSAKRSTNIPIVGVKVDKDKYVRAEAVTPEFESGRVSIPEDAAWFDEWMEEHIAFPSAKHDDYVDTSSGGLAQCFASATSPDP